MNKIVTFEKIKNAVEYAKYSENNKSVIVIPNDVFKNMMSIGPEKFFTNDIGNYLKENNCNIQILCEGTLCPKMIITYINDEQKES